MGSLSSEKKVDIAQESASAASSILETAILDNLVNAQHWREVYDLAGCEGCHRFDPDYKWTAEEEKRLVRKVMMFCALDLNRKNSNRAISDNMIFLACFLSAELPSGLVSKKVGAYRASQAALNTKTQYYTICAFLGLLMGRFIPYAPIQPESFARLTITSDIVLWLTYLYKSNELPNRLAWFWTALSTCNIVGSLIAAGGGWQYLFLIEGLITSAISVLSWGLMPPSPCQTKHWFRGKNAIKDWELWSLYIIGLLAYIPPAPPTTYLSYILRKLGFSVFQANLLAIPSQFLFTMQLLILTWFSERWKERSILSSLSNLWIWPWLLALALLLAKVNPWTRYVLLTGLLSYPYCRAILVGWNAKNSNTIRTRTVSAALYNIFVQSGNIIAMNIYQDSDQPLYRRGNKILPWICSSNILLFYLVKLFYIWRNKARERMWNVLTREQQDDYLANTNDEG
ncbi:MFS general substrate transporter [Lindgomyces ingoldianus]|uniref:MFS general substrate transporter n=1 Tax=Lindgomyces ingoldianus TaxID=673940 RepID=A0ACB6QN74_9PLEO|nr:MFS general substrate transporter [Lindgomyces ingoldianus]KAF2468038.1 MFS general substrate transporter [Lindgomyces ingoldianus]